MAKWSTATTEMCLLDRKRERQYKRIDVQILLFFFFVAKFVFGKAFSIMRSVAAMVLFLLL